MKLNELFEAEWPLASLSGRVAAWVHPGRRDFRVCRDELHVNCAFENPKAFNCDPDELDELYNFDVEALNEYVYEQAWDAGWVRIEIGKSPDGKGCYLEGYKNSLLGFAKMREMREMLKVYDIDILVVTLTKPGNRFQKFSAPIKMHEVISWLKSQ